MSKLEDMVDAKVWERLNKKLYMDVKEFQRDVLKMRMNKKDAHLLLKHYEKKKRLTCTGRRIKILQ